jgi:hypothetical protein
MLNQRIGKEEELRTAKGQSKLSKKQRWVMNMNMTVYEISLIMDIITLLKPILLCVYNVAQQY